MKTKKLSIMLALLLAVVALIVLTEKMGEQSGGPEAFFPELASDAIGAIAIAQNGDTVMVKRKGDIWVVAHPGNDVAAKPLAEDIQQTPSNGAASQSYRADSASVQSMLEKIENMKKGDLISTNPSKQETFEVDSAQGTYVSVENRDGKQVASFKIGKTGPEYSSNYVRLIGSDKVYTVGGSIKNSFFTDMKRWRDKTILSFDPSSVERVSLNKKGAESIVLKKDLDSLNQPSWRIEAPEQHPANTEEIQKLVNKLGSFKTSDWASDTVTEESLGFQEPELTVGIVFENGDEKIMSVGAETGGKFYVRTADSPMVYRVSDYAIRDIDKNLETLKAPPATAES
jgi:hypothetical protein